MVESVSSEFVSHVFLMYSGAYNSYRYIFWNYVTTCGDINSDMSQLPSVEFLLGHHVT